jgi:hypothetical protein
LRAIEAHRILAEASVLTDPLPILIMPGAALEIPVSVPPPVTEPEFQQYIPVESINDCAGPADHPATAVPPTDMKGAEPVFKKNNPPWSTPP